MSEVSYIPKGYNTITPYLVIKGAAKAIEYYKNVFGATVVERMDGPDGRVGHAELQIGDSRIMLADENPSMGALSAESIGASPVSLYVYIPDCDQVVEKAVADCYPKGTSGHDENDILRTVFRHLKRVGTV